MSHPGEEVGMERIEEDIADMSREEKVECIVECGIAPSDWEWSSLVVKEDELFGKPSWDETSMDHLIFDWKWESR